MSTTLTTCARARCYTRIGGFAKRVWRIGGWVCLDCAECCERCGCAPDAVRGRAPVLPGGGVHMSTHDETSCDACGASRDGVPADA